MTSSPPAGMLAGELYNALSARGYLVSRTTYFAQGGWRLRLSTRGGLIRGVPVVEYEEHAGRVTIKRRGLFKADEITSFVLDARTDMARLLHDIVGVVVQHWPRAD